MDKADGAQQNWRVSRQGEQICVFIFYAYGHGLDQMMTVHTKLLHLLVLAICDSDEK